MEDPLMISTVELNSIFFRIQVLIMCDKPTQKVIVFYVTQV